MSQSPELPATGWPDQPPEHAPYPAEQWTMPQPVLPPEAQQTQVVPPAAAEAEGSGLPSEFDHLFRGSPHDSRRSIDRQRPAVGAVAGPEAYQDPQYQGSGQSASQQAMSHESQYQAAQFQQPGFGTAYQHPAEAPPYPGEQYGQPEYPQAPGYGAPGYGNQGYGSPEFAGRGGDRSGGWDGNGGPGRAGNRKGWLIGGGIAAVAVIGIVYLVSSGGGSGKPNAHGTTSTTTSTHAATTAQDQAQAIYALIAQSGQLRSDANSAVVDVNDCRNLAAAQTTLQTTAQQRQNQADQVAKLDVSLIQNGSQLIQALNQAWSASAKYDAAYASIAGDVQSGCKTTQIKKDANYQTTNDQGATASQAKVQAADLWNTNVAGPLSQQQISEAKL